MVHFTWDGEDFAEVEVGIPEGPGRAERSPVGVTVRDLDLTAVQRGDPQPVPQGARLGRGYARLALYTHGVRAAFAQAPATRSASASATAGSFTVARIFSR